MAKATNIWQRQAVVPEVEAEGGLRDQAAFPNSFVTTQWSLIRSAGNLSSPDADAALETLCRKYWPAIHAYVRRFGYPVDDCRDLTQSFFWKLLEKNWLSAADPAKGKFRTFLLSALKHFLADERDRATAVKRGGGQRHSSLDWDFDEQRIAISESASPERAYDYQWAVTVLEEALEKLQHEFKEMGKGADFDALKSFISFDAASISHKEAATRLGVTEASAKMAVSRMRRRFREFVRVEIAHTVQDRSEIENEMQYLVEILRQ